MDAWNVARKADRLIWKNRAMVYISLEASNSRQYTRGVELARTIENAESRSEALLLLAEAQCRASLKTAIDMVDFLAGYLGGAAIREMRRADWPTVEYEALSSVATSTYQAAAEAVASIPQDGLRGVMVGFLIDSLIAGGRFDDARACTSIYPEESERFVALGAIAEAQGRRGLADSARRWIATEVPEAYRPALYRRVVTGVLWSVENERSKDLPGGADRPTAGAMTGRASGARGSSPGPRAFRTARPPAAPFGRSTRPGAGRDLGGRNAEEAGQEPRPVRAASWHGLPARVGEGHGQDARATPAGGQGPASRRARQPGFCGQTLFGVWCLRRPRSSHASAGRSTRDGCRMTGRTTRQTSLHRYVSCPIVPLRHATPPAARSPASSIDRIVKDRRQLLPSRASESCRTSRGTG